MLSSELMGSPSGAGLLIINAGRSSWSRRRHVREIDDGWKVRHTDLEFLISSQAREAVHREGIMIIDYRAIKDAWSGQWPDGQAAH